MSVAELTTAVRLGLPLLIVVYNDAAYGAEVHHFGPHGHPLDTVTLPGHRPGRDRARLRLRRRRPSARRDDLGAVARLARRSARPAAGGRREGQRPTRGSWWLEEAFRGH